MPNRVRKKCQLLNSLFFFIFFHLYLIFEPEHESVPDWTNHDHDEAGLHEDGVDLQTRVGFEEANHRERQVEEHD